MNCDKCGMSIPDGADICINCALPKKDRIVSMKAGWKQPIPKRAKKTAKKTS